MTRVGRTKQVMPTERTGAGRVFAPWNPAVTVTFLWLHLGLLLQDSVNGQSECSVGMCKRPPSTISTQTTAENTTCYPSDKKLILLCNPGFRLSGINYTTSCNKGVWTPDNGCRIDLVTVLVAASASMVAILIFFLCVLCVSSWRRNSKKRKEHKVSKVKGEKKKRARAKADTEAANGRRVANGHVEDPDEFDDDFTDDEEEIVVPVQDTSYDHENIYQNQAF